MASASRTYLKICVATLVAVLCVGVAGCGVTYSVHELRLRDSATLAKASSAAAEEDVRFIKSARSKLAGMIDNIEATGKKLTECRRTCEQKVRRLGVPIRRRLPKQGH
ncbi:MAG: hypothetical protein KDD44_01140 [Bdellovibrionales bacterium]|nr:hypothetical protein [Bdellovibrionales bacterium]